MTKKNLPGNILLVVLLLFAIVFPVSGQELSLSLNPPHLETIIMPGKAIQVTYKVQNLGDPAVVKVGVLPFIPKEDGGVVIQEEFSGPVRFSVENNPILLDKPFLLNSKQTVEIPLHIRIPEGAPAADYYYTFFVENEPAPPIEGRGAAPRIKGRVGSNMLITVSTDGVLETKGKISLFDTLGGFKLGNLRVFDSGEMVSIALIARNEGKNFVQAQGQIALKGNFGERAAYELEPANILAQSQRLLTSTKQPQVDCQDKNEIYCLRPVTFLLSGFFIGKYELSANVNFGEGTPQLSAQATFIALPLKFLGVLLVVLVVGVVLGRRKSKR